MLKYHNTFSDATTSDIARAFLYGLRFDLSTAAMVTVPLLALLIMLLVWFNAILVYDFVDIQYYAFAQRHVTFEAQSAFHDLGTLLGIGLRHYLLDLAVLVVLLALFSWV